MNKPIVLAVGSGRNSGKTHLMALYTREKVADDMYNKGINIRE